MNHKQRVASRRNFLKFQVSSTNFKMSSEGGIQNCEFLTKAEHDRLQSIMQQARILLDHWDTNSTKLGMKVKPREQEEF